MDGNTRLCTATAAAAMKESFGADGQPGSYTDIDSCDALFLYGHNMAETQTVLWSRVLDRIAGPDRPRIVCVDPRNTEVARHADVHLAIRPGTNLALMHALVREVLAQGWEDAGYVRDHTLGLDDLRKMVEPWTAEAAAAVCGVPASDIRDAARIFGTSDRIVSTVLQGFYQSSQATAASCQVNNLHLLRGMLGPRTRCPPNERPAHGAEQQGMRRGRGPAVIDEVFDAPSAGTPRPHCRRAAVRDDCAVDVPGMLEGSASLGGKHA